jgi:hypothetical protein
MTRSTKTLLAALATAGALLTMNACATPVVKTGATATSSSTSEPSSDSTSDSSADVPDSDPTTADPARDQLAHIGSTIELDGQDDGAKIEVTLVKVVRTDHGRDSSWDSPAKGMRYLSIQWRIKNTGTVVYSDSPTNGSQVTNSADESFDSTLIFDGTKAGVQFSSSLKIAKGHKGLGYITYEVPKNANIVSAQFSQDSGFGDTGEWLLK